MDVEPALHALERDVTDERAVKFAAAMLEAEETLGELRERFGISRKQGHKWKERYEVGGHRTRWANLCQSKVKIQTWQMGDEIDR